MLSVLLFHTVAYAQSAQFTVCSPGQSLAGTEACDCWAAPLVDWADGNAAIGWPAVSHVSVTSGSVAESIKDTCFDMTRFVTDTDIPDATERHQAGALLTIRGHQAAQQIAADHGGVHGFSASFDSDAVCTSTELMSMDGGEAYLVLPLVVKEVDVNGASVVYELSTDGGEKPVVTIESESVPVLAVQWPLDDDEEDDVVITFEDDAQWWIAGPFEDGTYTAPE